MRKRKSGQVKFSCRLNIEITSEISVDNSLIRQYKCLIAELTKSANAL